MNTLEGIYKKETLHIASEWMKCFMAKQTVMGHVSNSCAPILPHALATPNITPIPTINNPPHPAACNHLGLTIALDSIQ